MSYYYGFIVTIIVNSAIWFVISTVVNKYYWNYTGFKEEMYLMKFGLSRINADIVKIHMINMYIRCNSCSNEFNDLVEGIRYSSSTKGLLWFCSDDCCKNYLNKPGNAVNH